MSRVRTVSFFYPISLAAVPNAPHSSSQKQLGRRATSLRSSWRDPAAALRQPLRRTFRCECWARVGQAPRCRHLFATYAG